MGNKVLLESGEIGEEVVVKVVDLSSDFLYGKEVECRHPQKVPMIDEIDEIAPERVKTRAEKNSDGATSHSKSTSYTQRSKSKKTYGNSGRGSSSTANDPENKNKLLIGNM